ncbi:TetR/AcrR family transcriptional regulator [uncultured Flavonifractor sp.]|uniref:TetR/AcrR family transcriptional regulator n=1 Tax=uncultured Flavonifractor sp. TaxID=1193534 RepID=UPI00262E065F|nr:TetR/AcrR family transcriptional regulator [uncultured Flavonifractor sp.]
MPSTTFFHLPEEKRQRLLGAARAEFVRVPYEEASINRIIREAGIPRGSFYMYFTDKEDLFRYLMETYGELLIQRMGERLDWNRGDLFAASLALFDHVQANWHSGEFREMAAILRRNRQLQPGLVLNRQGPCAVLDRLRGQIDLSRLDLQTDTDLPDLFHLLIASAAGAVVSMGKEGSPEQVRARLVRMLDLLRRGAAAKSSPCNEV